MKRKPRKLTLSRETLRALEDRSLGRVGGGQSEPGCTNVCDTDTECSTDCDHPTNLWYLC